MRRRLVTIAAIAMGLAIWKIVGDPNLRSGLAWAIHTWFVPPDAEARWEQGPG